MRLNLALRRLWLLVVVGAAAAASADDQIPARKDTIVVTGAYEPVPLGEVDGSINAFDLRDVPLLYGNWTDYIRLESSLDLRQRAPNGVQADLSIRGASFGQTLVLVNGLRMNDAQSGHHNLDVSLPADSIQRIEVLRGAGSTLYGSDAVGGVVNFIVSPPTVSNVRLGLAVGNLGTNQQYGSATYARQRFRQQVSFSRDFSSGFQPDRDYRNLALGTDTQVTTALGTSSLVVAYGDRPFGADQFYGPYNSWERTRTWLGAFNQELGTKTEVALAYRRHTDRFVLYRDRPAAFTNDHATEAWQAVVRRRQRLAPNARLFYGGEGYRDAIVSTNLGQHARHRAAGYLDLDVRALRRFSFSVGAREDVYGRTRGQFSPGLNGGLWISPGLKLHAAASRAFRLPSYTDLFYHDPTTRGSPDLRPESAWGYEGGLNCTRGKLNGAITIFHRRERDGIDYLRYSPIDIWRAVNLQNLHFTGVEASAHVNVSESQWLEFSYAALHGAQASLGNAMSRYVFNYPVHNGMIAWNGLLPGRILARTRFGVTERLSRDPYPLWDIALGRKLGRLSPYAQLENVTGTQYQEVSGVPMPGRSAIIGVQVEVCRNPKH